MSQENVDTCGVFLAAFGGTVTSTAPFWGPQRDVELAGQRWRGIDLDTLVRGRVEATRASSLNKSPRRGRTVTVEAPRKCSKHSRSGWSRSSGGT